LASSADRLAVANGRRNIILLVGYIYNTYFSILKGSTQKYEGLVKGLSEIFLSGFCWQSRMSRMSRMLKDVKGCQGMFGRPS
jgi:hypothetical protein